MSGKAQLHRLSQEAIAIDAALSVYGRLAPSWEESGAWAILSTPWRCAFAMLEAGGALIQHPRATVDLKDVFELRAFSDAGELRWVRRPGGAGTVHLVSERDLSPLGLGWQSSTEKIAVTLDNAYLLWGRRGGTSTDPPWVRHTDPRIGSLWVPYRAQGVEPTAWMHTKEYLVEAEYGNLAVGDELLVAVSDVPPAGAPS